MLELNAWGTPKKWELEQLPLLYTLLVMSLAGYGILNHTQDTYG
jgi:hypothetical protein